MQHVEQELLNEKKLSLLRHYIKYANTLLQQSIALNNPELIAYFKEDLDDLVAMYQELSTTK